MCVWLSEIPPPWCGQLLCVCVCVWLSKTPNASRCYVCVAV
jgi:hypothetical protein